MNKSKILFVGTFFIMAFVAFTACDKKVGKTPEPEPVVPINSCDTITYTKYIKPIVDGNCALSGCHDGSNSNPNLNNYSELKDRADAGRIKARVLDESPSRMPPAPSNALTSAQKELISCWLANGKKQ